MRNIVTSSATQAGIDRIKGNAQRALIGRRQASEEMLEARRRKIEESPVGPHSTIFVKRPFWKRLLRGIAKLHGFEESVLTGPQRTQKVVLARQHAIYEILRLCPRMSAAQVGRIFNRDHTTILHSISAFHAKTERLGVTIAPMNRKDLTTGNDAEFFRQRNLRYCQARSAKKLVSQ